MENFSPQITLINDPPSSRLPQISYREALFDVLRQNRPNGTNDIVTIPLEAPPSTSFSSDNIVTSSHISMHSKDYTDGPGELDMLVGFFLMNIVCIGFFLGFGMCVICSCVRRRPRLFNSNSSVSKSLLPRKASKMPQATIVESAASSVKPNFKSIASRTIVDKNFKQLALSGSESKTTTKLIETKCPTKASLRKTSTNIDETQKLINGESIEMASLGEPRRRVSSRSMQLMPSNSKTITKTFSMPSSPALCNACQTPVKIKIETDQCDENGDTVELNDENDAENGGENSMSIVVDEIEDEPEPSSSSAIRSNLLGPLSFDDLYYA